MLLFIQYFIINKQALPALFGRNAGRSPFVQQAIPEPIGIIALTLQQMFGRWKVTQQHSGICASVNYIEYSA